MAQGSGTVVKVRVSNTASTSVNGVAVRLTLPASLVPKSSAAATAPVIANGPNGTRLAYWTNLTLPRGKRLTLKLQLRPCVNAPLGGHSVKGAALLVNATNDATCLTRAAPPAVVRVG